MNRFLILFLLISSICFGAVDLDGTADYIVCGNTNIPTNADMTIIAVVNFDVNNASQCIVGYAVNAGVGWGAFGGNAGALWFVKYGTVAVIGPSYSANTWYSMAMRVDVSTEVEFYTWDGTTYTNQTVADSGALDPPADSAITIGRKSASLSADYFNGEIAHVAIYDSMLSDYQIESILKSQLKGIVHQYSPANLVGDWWLDDFTSGSGLNTDADGYIDRSVNVNHGQGVDGDASALNTGEFFLTYPIGPVFKITPAAAAPAGGAPQVIMVNIS